MTKVKLLKSIKLYIPSNQTSNERNNKSHTKKNLYYLYRFIQAVFNLNNTHKTNSITKKKYKYRYKSQYKY